jgi:hypothetical protein
LAAQHGRSSTETAAILYGKQKGTVVGDNLQKPGRPSPSYHRALMANIRLALRPC